MADERLRNLERRWRETGTLEDEAVYLRERIRQGDLSERKLYLAAYLGIPGAIAALDEDERPCMGDMKRVREQRERLYALCPGADPTPLDSEGIRAVSDADPRIHHRLLLLLTMVGMGSYGGGVTLHRPAPAPGQEGLRLFGQAGERSLVYYPKGAVSILGASGLERRFDDALDWFERHLRQQDPAYVPWHVANATRRGRDDPVGWSARTRAWCEQTGGGGFSLRTHLRCPRCRFPFIYRTSNYSLSSSADVQNWGSCADPDCRHSWTEWS
jgi:hypothetical protein